MSARGRITTDVSLIALALAAAALSVASLAPVSAVLVYAAALTLPGAAIATRLTLDEPLAAAGLVVGLSLAVDVVVGLALIWSRWWHPGVVVALVAAAACAVLAVDARRRGAASRDGAR